MSESVKDMVAFQKLDDSVIDRIRHSRSKSESMTRAKEIVKKIFNRDLYKFVGRVELRENDKMEDVQAKINEKLSRKTSATNLIFQKAEFDYGSKDKNPMDKVFFFRKHNPKEPVRIGKHEVSQMLPTTFSETFCRVYLKNVKDFKEVKEAFEDWNKLRTAEPQHAQESGSRKRKEVS